jgi:flagellar biosynthetic protein FliO
MKLPNILLIILFVALLSLNAGAQANEGAVLKAETSTKVDLPSKSKVVSSPTPAPTAPPLASVPESKPQELPFKLNERQQLATEAPSAGGMLLRTFGALLLIVGLIAAAGWALRHFGVINFGKQHSDAAGLKVLDTVQLGDRRTLTLVKFGERTLLIGSTPQGLSLLAEQAEELELPQGDYMPTVRTVTDLLDVNAAPPFEQELTRASLINTNWSDRSVQ